MDVDAEVKEEEEPADEKSENEVEPDAVEDAPAGEEPAVSNDLYKAFRNITEVLTNLKVKIKGDECVPRFRLTFWMRFR